MAAKNATLVCIVRLKHLILGNPHGRGAWFPQHRIHRRGLFRVDDFSAAWVCARMLLWLGRDGCALNFMPDSIKVVLEFALLAITSVFFLVDPFAVIPLFLAVTADSTPSERRGVARRSAMTCAIVLCSFALAGSLIFKMFGITLPAFKIAGGIILMGIGLDMLQAKQSGTKATAEEQQEGAEKQDASIIPLGMPMLAGPGAISTVMVLVGESHSLWQHGVIYATILLTSFISFMILAGADGVRKYLGETGIRILMRLMGLLLVALAVQFVVNGLTDFGLLKPLATPY
jgi:multiple antibiotic resistance protein